MSHTVRCYCTNPVTVPLIKLKEIANSKAISDTCRSLSVKGCNSVDLALVEYVKFYRNELEHDQFCVVSIPRRNTPCAQPLEVTGFEVSFI
jgi:hypothetical protein